MDPDELYVSFFFPPDSYVSGITVFKRILSNGHSVDVLHSSKSHNSVKSDEHIDKYISNRITVDMDCGNDSADCIFGFIKKAMRAIEKDYAKIYSRSWVMANHFLAFEYKLSNPAAFWSAEFSDPLMFNISNRQYSNAKMTMDNRRYFNKVNRQIEMLNENTANDFPLIENMSPAFFVCEYLVYLFADKVIFTNENQREIMLDQFPVDVRDFVLAKSEILPHPTLPEEYYHMQKSGLKLSDDLINIAYFGSDYYGRRHFEGLFYALESLNHKHKDKIRLHIFINDRKLLKKLVSPLASKNLITIRKPLPYLKFLNATTQFDVLVVNDVSTQGSFKINPYLPSKLSDYLGSSADIWAISEKGSALSKSSAVRYESDIRDCGSSAEALVKILSDRGYGDDDCSFDDYYADRLTYLNELYEKEFRKNLRLKKELEELKSKRFKLF